MTLNKEWIKNTWIPALRSGDYQQGRGALRQHMKEGDAYCCLGVACDLLKEQFNAAWKQNQVRETAFDYFMPAGRARAGALPDDVAEFIGITDSGSMESPNGTHEHCLAFLNDNGSTFNQIATIIERAINEDGIRLTPYVDKEQP